MPYPTHLLNDRESMALDLRPHWWYFSKHILTGIPLLILWILETRIEDGTVQGITSGILGVLTIIWAIWLLLKFISWTRTYFVVTDQRVIYRTGVISRHGVEIPLERINNINFHQGIWERMIGAGDLEVQSAGEQGTTMFENVRHPDGVQQEIYRQMEHDATRDAGRGADAVGKAVADALQQQGGGGGGAGASAGQTVPEQIEALARLRDQGHITAAEYEKKKTELLEKM
jgi:membrane protein YdbS with pleckstrin-like domain